MPFYRMKFINFRNYFEIRIFADEFLKFEFDKNSRIFLLIRCTFKRYVYRSISRKWKWKFIDFFISNSLATVYLLKIHSEKVQRWTWGEGSGFLTERYRVRIVPPAKIFLKIFKRFLTENDGIYRFFHFECTWINFGLSNYSNYSRIINQKLIKWIFYRKCWNLSIFLFQMIFNFCELIFDRKYWNLSIRFCYFECMQINFGLYNYSIYSRIITQKLI